MGSGFIYTNHVANTKKNKKAFRFLRTLFVAGILLFAIPFTSIAQSPPQYILGTDVAISACAGSTIPIDSILGITGNANQTITWQAVAIGTGFTSLAPYGSSLTGFPNGGTTPFSNPSNDTLYPTAGSFFYTAPSSNANGNDFFQIQVSDGTNTNLINVTVQINATPSFTLGSNPIVCTGQTNAVISFSNVVGVGPHTDTFQYDGIQHVYVVPSGISSLNFDAWGAPGGSDNISATPNPGKGARVQGTLSVLPGEALWAVPGGPGSNGSTANATTPAFGGYNGGGNAYFDPGANVTGGAGGGGGGASDIRIGGTALSNRYVVAGGGAGNGWDSSLNAPFAGGDGGGLTGVNGQANDVSSFATGGTQSAGGSGASYSPYASGSSGIVGVGGDGANDLAAGYGNGISGGGGGGYYGGGGGVWTGGAGGSSYANGGVTNLTMTPGFNTGIGYVFFSYTTVGIYTISWGGPSSAAAVAGFTDVPATPLPGSGNLIITVPATAPAATYTATLTLSNGICSTDYPISVTVNQTPDVVPVSNITACNNSPETVNFSSTTAGGATYSWKNSNTGIGAPASGTGNISFTATNTSSGPLTGVFTVTPTLNGCTGDSMSFAITTNPQPALTLGTFPTICAGATTATLPFTGLQNIGPFTDSFSYLGGNPQPQTFVVPAGITSISFDATGGIGGLDDQSTVPVPGKGGRITGVINVNPGDTLSVLVGGAGFNGSPFGAAGGFNGGGSASFYGGIGGTGCGGGGGGASDIRLNGTSLTDRVVVAGGGGGTGWDSPVGGYAGGDAGGLSGANSAANVNGSFAGGGTQTNAGAGAIYPGWIPGGNGAAGVGGNGSVQGVSGGGGGGYYGGGGGIWNGGGGGSSFADPITTTLVNYTPGYNIGHGYVKLNYTTTGTYTITNWDPLATSAGFTNVPTTALPTSAFSIPIPASAPSGIYTAQLTIDNGICQNVYAIQVTINPLPTVPGVTSQTVCNNTTTVTESLVGLGSIPTTKFYWTNDNASIGLASVDSGDVTSFTAMDTTNVSQIGDVVITPVDTSTGCVGDTTSFTITVNPTPTLSSLLNPAAICSGPVNYVPATLDTAVTTINWTRATMAGISSPLPASGSSTITESLIDTFVNQVAVPYVFTLSSNSGILCVNTQTVTVTVNPLPMFINSVTDTVCSGSPLGINLVSLTPGTTFAWTHDVPPGLATLPVPGTGSLINDALTNISANLINVDYSVTMTAYGCSNGQNLFVTVHPVPQLSSPLMLTTVCSGDTINYTATSATSASETVSFMSNRVANPGITPSTYVVSGPDIHEAVTNTTTFPIMVLYQYNLSVGACPAPVETVSVTVNPIPQLTSATHPGAIACSGTPLIYHYTSSSDPGTTFDWVRPLAYGISNTHMTGSGDINETLTDTTVLSDTIPYAYTLRYGSCASSDTIWAVINPIPVFTSAFADTAICDSIGFTYVPSSSTPGATYAWNRDYVPGIVNVSKSASGNIMDTLINTTYTDVTAMYTVTVMANGCTGSSKPFNVTIHPTPKLSSTLTPHYICNGEPFSYHPTSYTTGTIFDWTRPAVPGVNYFSGSALTSYGVGDIYERLFDSNYTEHIVTYNIRLTANGCTNLYFDQVKLVVSPGPQLPGIVTTSPSSPCSNTLYQTYGAGAPPASGISYDWYANNATIWSMTADHQFAYVNFNYPGTAYVRLEGTINLTGCETFDSLFVNVGTGVADNPKVIYYEGEFICLQSNMDSYQWGYDDMATFASTTITGATNQNYYDPTADLTHNRYWVITNHNGCMQKSYYNGPLGINDVNASDIGEMKLFPNPTKDNINVEIITTTGGEMQVEVLNLLGQKLTTVPAINQKATIDVSALPGGCYLIDCYRNGIKIATSRFIKN